MAVQQLYVIYTATLPLVMRLVDVIGTPAVLVEGQRVLATQQIMVHKHLVKELDVLGVLVVHAVAVTYVVNGITLMLLLALIIILIVLGLAVRAADAMAAHNRAVLFNPLLLVVFRMVAVGTLLTLALVHLILV